jgi:transglutaminase-like putative cysteine protease
LKFGVVHRLMTDALAALGLLSLVTSGELDPWMTTAIVVGLIIAVLVPERFQEHPRAGNVGAALSVALLVAQVTRLFLGADALQLAVEFAGALQVIRLGTRRGAAHDQQIILLALVHLVAGTVLGSGLAYGLCFFGFLVVAPGALVLSHLRREVEGNYRQGARDRTGLPVDVPRILRSRRVISRRFLVATCSLSIPIFVFTALLFVLFPRVGLSLLLLGHSHSTRMIGFSDRVDLGGVGKLRTDPTIAMRVAPSRLPANPPPRISLYLRGTAFDRYDGTTWQRTRTGRYPADQQGALITVRPYSEPVSPDTLHIDLEPISPPVIMLPPDAVAFRLLARGEPVLGHPTPIFMGPEGEYKYSGDDRGLRYEVLSRGAGYVPAEPLDGAERVRYLSLPQKLPERVVRLAKDWTRGAHSPRESADLIERHLRNGYKYDLDSPSGGAKNPLDHFLFESKRGHCEFYSTAMAILLRAVGIPTRNVTGFVGGTYNRFGRFYAVRQGDAHSWVEVYLDGAGWTLFDPTPAAGAVPQVETAGLLALVRDIAEAAAQRWSRYVVGYDLEQQLRLLKWFAYKYGGSSSSSGWLSGNPQRRRTLVVAAMLASLIGFAYWQWLRRKRSPTTPTGDAGESFVTAQIVALYRSLEAAMMVRGVPRVASTPPLAHAQGLVALGHPIGDEVLALTEQYLEVRYAGRALTEHDRREFARRVREVREGAGPPSSSRARAA